MGRWLWKPLKSWLQVWASGKWPWNLHAIYYWPVVDSGRPCDVPLGPCGSHGCESLLQFFFVKDPMNHCNDMLHLTQEAYCTKALPPYVSSRFFVHRACGDCQGRVPFPTSAFQHSSLAWAVCFPEDSECQVVVASHVLDTMSTMILAWCTIS